MVDQELFDYLAHNHGITILESEAIEIEKIMFRKDYYRLNWDGEIYDDSEYRKWVEFHKRYEAENKPF